MEKEEWKEDGEAEVYEDEGHLSRRGSRRNPFIDHQCEIWKRGRDEDDNSSLASRIIHTII